MSVQTITRLQMPKWGLSMTEGTFGKWLVDEGAALNPGDEVAEVDTEKISGLVEATSAGVPRRRGARVAGSPSRAMSSRSAACSP